MKDERLQDQGSPFRPVKAPFLFAAVHFCRAKQMLATRQTSQVRACLQTETAQKQG